MRGSAKRATIAQEKAEAGRIRLNGQRVEKASANVRIGDVLTCRWAARWSRCASCNWANGAARRRKRRRSTKCCRIRRTRGRDGGEDLQAHRGRGRVQLSRDHVGGREGRRPAAAPHQGAESVRRQRRIVGRAGLEAGRPRRGPHPPDGCGRDRHAAAVAVGARRAVARSRTRDRARGDGQRPAGGRRRASIPIA